MEDEYPLRDLTECTARSGIPNFLAKCRRNKTLNVAYFGGSITCAPGWRVMSLEMLHALYHQNIFNEIYAPIGGTGSDLGVFRMERDVLSYKPDLLFVEFAVNDSNTDDDTIRRSMEGIIRNTWQVLPECDIIFIYTFTIKLMAPLKAGKLFRSACVMEELADHYGIPSVFLGCEVLRLESEGKLIIAIPQARIEQVSGKEIEKNAGIQANPDGKIPFSQDGVHPYMDTGHKLYAEAIARSWPKIEAASSIGATHVRLPAPLANDFVGSVTFSPADAATLGGEWHKVENPGSTLGHRPNLEQFVPSVWRAKPGSTLSCKFMGRSLMIYGVTGPQTGFVEVTVDGKTSKRNCFDPYCAYWRLAPFFPAVRLDPAVKHTFQIKVLDDIFSKRSIIATLGSEKTYDDNPDGFVGTYFLLGGICIEGGSIVQEQ